MLKITNHAKDRMRERNITEGDIHEVLSMGNEVDNKSDYASKYIRYKDIMVVKNWDDSIKTVIKDEVYSSKLEISKLRNIASKLAEEFKKLYSDSKEAYDGNRRDLAKELSNRGKMKQKECEEINFKIKNMQQEINRNNPNYFL